MTQNFDPVGLAADVAKLCQEVADIKAIIAGDRPFNIADVAEVGEAGVAVAANFLPRLAQIEQILAPLVPILPRLQEMFAGDIAGVGKTQLAALAGDESAILPVEASHLPAEQLGNYSEVKPNEPAPDLSNAHGQTV